MPDITRLSERRAITRVKGRLVTIRMLEPGVFVIDDGTGAPRKVSGCEDFETALLNYLNPLSVPPLGIPWPATAPIGMSP